MPKDEISRLERLADLQEMRDALTRYCQGTDRCDADLMASAFWPDSSENHGPFVGKSHDFCAMVIPMLRDQYEALFRYVTNFTAEFNSEHGAESEAYWCAILRDPTLDLFQMGRYLDRWERRQGTWKIAARIAVVDFWRQDPRNYFKFPHEAQAIMTYTKRGLKDKEVRAILGLN